jgi:hypothetical protein
MKKYLVILIVFFASACFAQNISIGSRSIALNSQQALVSEAAGTTFFNPSLLLERQGYSVWLNHYKPYSIAEINVYALAASYSTGKYSAGAGYLEFGNKLYRDQFFNLSVAYRIVPRLAIGVKYKFRNLSIQNYGRASVSALDFGLHIPATETISIGMLIKNVIAGKMSENEAPANREVRSALRVRIPGSVLLFAEIAQEENFGAEYRLGFEYALFEKIALLIGSGIETPESFSGGLGFRLGRFQLNYALQNHPALDQSHIFTIVISGGK